MNRRTIPFGYKFENGAVVVEDSAADIVKEIFNRYLAGDSMLNISELLNKLHVEYTPGITGWNKARIKRILEVTIQNDKKLYTCTKEILKYRIEGLQMKKG